MSTAGFLRNYWYVAAAAEVSRKPAARIIDVDAAAMLMVDNPLDLSHLPFLHARP